ncbi:MAG: hypothetical protein KDJ27_03910 [Gammaproteobacteria bacterium]|nr:hypothetical protein [Gammaproteobacteria bacterium]
MHDIDSESYQHPCHPPQEPQIALVAQPQKSKPRKKRKPARPKVRFPRPRTFAEATEQFAECPLSAYLALDPEITNAKLGYYLGVSATTASKYRKNPDAFPRDKHIAELRIRHWEKMQQDRSIRVNLKKAR